MSKDTVEEDLNHALYKIASELLDESVNFSGIVEGRGGRLFVLGEIDAMLHKTPLRTKVRIILTGLHYINQLLDRYVHLWLTGLDPELRMILEDELRKQKNLMFEYRKVS